MRKMLTRLFLVGFLFSFTQFIYAQGTMKFHFGPSFPISDYGDDNAADNDAGGAQIGIGAGLIYVYELPDIQGLGLFGGVDAHFHGLKKDYKDDIEAVYADNVDLTFLNYLNVPVSAGLQYTINTSGVGIFANAGLALNLLKVTKFKVEAGNDEAEQTFELSPKVGLRLGGGIVINDRTTISLSYFNPGEHDIDWEVDQGANTQNGDSEQNVSFIDLTIGFTIN